MNSKLIALLTASSIALGVAGGASAQHAQLDSSVMSGLSLLGITVPEGVMLTEDQVAQIENVLAGTEADSDRVARIGRILDEGMMEGHGMSPQMLQDSVGSDLAALGFGGVAVGDLSLMQVAEIENVTASTDHDSIKKSRIETILGGTMEGSDAAGDSRMLMDSVSSDLASLGVSTAGVGMLSLTQLAEIENITGSTDTDQTKVERVNLILAQ